MDDFIILAKTKKEAISIKKQVELFLNNVLQLELNDKSRYYPSAMGVNFCGYRIFTTHRLLRLNSKKKVKRHVKNWNKLYLNNSLDLPKTLERLNSWIAHSSHCNSYNLQQKVLNECNFIINNKYYENKESELISLSSHETQKKSYYDQ